MSTHAPHPTVAQLAATLHEIGVARFEGRIEAGLIDKTEGEAVMEQFIEEQRTRPWVSRVANLVLDTDEAYR